MDGLTGGIGQHGPAMFELSCRGDFLPVGGLKEGGKMSPQKERKREIFLGELNVSMISPANRI